MTEASASVGLLLATALYITEILIISKFSAPNIAFLAF